MLYSFFKNLFALLFKLLYRFEVSGVENIPADGPVILASNHVSNWDPLALGSGSNRQVHFLAKEELFKFPLLNILLPAWGAIPLRRGRGDREAISKSMEVLSRRNVLGIFIEGKRNRGNPDKMCKPHSGAAMMALKSEAFVIPTLLINTRTIGKSFRKVKVIFGQPLKFTLDDTIDKKEHYAMVSQQIVEAIEKLRPPKKA